MSRSVHFVTYQRYFVTATNFHFFFGREECEIHINSYLKLLGCLIIDLQMLSYYSSFKVPYFVQVLHKVKSRGDLVRSLKDDQC